VGLSEFIAYLVKNIVDKPESVQVQVIEGQKFTMVEVCVAEEDIAKVVGRQGRTIQSLRTIAMVVGARFGLRVRLELVQVKDQSASS
jgi:predicted RNA-binding protein YlqC (UPF0109 family)